MKKILRAVLALSLIMLLLIFITSTFDYWPYDSQPRAFAPLHWIVRAFATGPFGESSTIVWLWTALASGVMLFASTGVTIARNPSMSERQARRAGTTGLQASAIRRRRIGSIADHAGDTADFSLQDIAALFGTDREIEPGQAWRLVEKSPGQTATSWLGGLPHAPANFSWPRTQDRRSMLFLAQIDLAAGTFPGLPASGSILFFLGMPSDNGWPYEARILESSKSTKALALQAPSNAIRPAEVGWFQNIGPTLQQTFVSLLPYEDRNSEEPVSKLFGVEVEDPFGFHYPEGYRNLLFVEHDGRFGTGSEHWQGMSIACPASDLAYGKLNTGRIFGCHNG